MHGAAPSGNVRELEVGGYGPGPVEGAHAGFPGISAPGGFVHKLRLRQACGQRQPALFAAKRGVGVVEIAGCKLRHGPENGRSRGDIVEKGRHGFLRRGQHSGKRSKNAHLALYVLVCYPGDMQRVGEKVPLHKGVPEMHRRIINPFLFPLQHGRNHHLREIPLLRHRGRCFLWSAGCQNGDGGKYKG